LVFTAFLPYLTAVRKTLWVYRTW